MYLIVVLWTCASFCLGAAFGILIIGGKAMGGGDAEHEKFATRVFFILAGSGLVFACLAGALVAVS